MTKETCDVLIAGAGPAGSSLALRLARAGFHVRLVEARRFPRFKPCGEFMTPQCVRILSELGLDGELESLGLQRIRGMRLYGFAHAAHGRYVAIGHARPPVDHGYAVRRDVFDAALLRAAAAEGSVEHHSGLRVTGLLRDGDGAVLGVRTRDLDGEDRDFRARFTIGADGLRSAVAGALGVRRPIAWLQKLALTTRYAGVRAGDQAEVHFFPGGYFVAHLVDQHLFSVNLVVDTAVVRGSGLDPTAFFEREIGTCPRMHARLAGAQRIDPVRGIGPLAYTTSRQTFDGAALVGDAAGYVDPVTGEGVFIALRGAELLAESLAIALHAGRTDAASLRPYLAGRRREIVPRTVLARLLQRGLRHDWLVEAALGWMQRHRSAGDLAVSLAGDYVPLSELARVSVWRAVLRREGAVTEPAAHVLVPRRGRGS